MDLPYEDILNLLQQFAEHKNIRVCAKQSALIGGITGLSAIVGGLLAGRNGALAGAAIGTVTMGLLTDNYVSVIHQSRTTTHFLTSSYRKLRMT